MAALKVVSNNSNNSNSNSNSNSNNHNSIISSIAPKATSNNNKNKKKIESEEEKTARYRRQEAYNHEFITSEEFYVSELESIVKYIVKPLRANCSRCGILLDDVVYVFDIFNHMFSFHLQILRIIRDKLSVISTLYQYCGFIKMYTTYISHYNNILLIISKWSKSNEFRSFILLRLQNTRVKYLDNKLSSLSWYLYRPIERIKQYYCFLNDLLLVTRKYDNNYIKLIKCLNLIKNLYYNKIRGIRDINFQSKTRLIEIQLKIFGNPTPILHNRRYFIYNRICQIKYSFKYKYINLYLFNDNLLWVSKRGHFKKQFYFINNNLIYGKLNSEELFIQYTSVSKYVKNNINYGKPTKKIILIFVNDIVRNDTLNKIKYYHQKHLQKLQKIRNLNNAVKPKVNLNNNNHNNMHLNDQSITLTDDSYYVNYRDKYKPLNDDINDIIVSNNDDNISDDTEQDYLMTHEQSIESKSKSQSSTTISTYSNTKSNSNISNKIIKQSTTATATAAVSASASASAAASASVSAVAAAATTITTIQEEDENDIKNDDK